MAKQDKAAPANAVYNKQQLLASRRYARHRDLLGALLTEDKAYSAAEVDAMIQDYQARRTH